ncbi:MAG: TlyA family RNA methyltransferase [Calditerrivibrio sp.]|nr:TlyA family RNA methyltransferase [Calditerrivibrio sp.]
MKKYRLDELLVIKGLAQDRKSAQSLILSGRVRSGETVLDKVGTLLELDADIFIKNISPFVSRAGHKLKKAAEVFQIDFHNKVVMDVGSSTGGFTDVCIQHGAKMVYAIDVGKGLLDYHLRNDPRVVVREGVNFRDITFDQIGEKVDLVVGDLSFISLTLVSKSVELFCKEGTEIVLLIKPQFEARKEEVEKGGIVKRKDVHKRVLRDVLLHYMTTFCFCGLTISPIKGTKGNIEYLVFFMYKNMFKNDADLEEIINKVVDEEYSYCCKTTC